jgi:hypothetical protein
VSIGDPLHLFPDAHAAPTNEPFGKQALSPARQESPEGQFPELQAGTHKPPPASEHVNDEFTIEHRVSPSEPDGQFTTHTLLRHVMLEPPGPEAQLLFGPQAAPGNDPFGKQAFSF